MMQRASVDFPEPYSPTMARLPCLGKVNETLFTAMTPFVPRENQLRWPAYVLLTDVTFSNDEFEDAFC